MDDGIVIFDYPKIVPIGKNFHTSNFSIELPIKGTLKIADTPCRSDGIKNLARH